MFNFIKTKLTLVLGVSFLLVSFFLWQTPSQAQNTQAKSVSVKIGYFNLPLVKASYPPASNSEILKAQAESKLREELKSIRENINKMRTDKKPEADIKRFQEISQAKISAKQQAYTDLLANQSNQVKVSIARAVDSVAKSKGLDIVLDGQGLFAGGKMVLDNGVDITREVVAKLNPSAGSTAPKPAASTSSQPTN